MPEMDKIYIFFYSWNYINSACPTGGSKCSGLLGAQFIGRPAVVCQTGKHKSLEEWKQFIFLQKIYQDI